MRVLIWGAGAMGGTIGAYLIRAGHDVTLVDIAADHVAAMNVTGLRLTGPVDEFTVRARAFTPEEVSGTWPAILLCVKAHHTAEATRALAPHLADDGYVVSIQNGLNELVIASIVGEARTIGAFVNFGADYLGPGVIHRGNRAAVVIGELDGRITPRLQALHATLRDFDDRAMITTNLWGYLWGKLAYGAQLFATALTDESIADALALPAYRDLFIALAREVLTVAAARGIVPEGFDGFDPRAFLPGVEPAVSSRSLDDMVAFNRASAKTHSGIWRDLAVRKRRTEVDAQLGPIVTLGAEVGVPTPLTARLIELIHDIEEGRRAQSLATLDALNAVLSGG
ncbi:MAG: ketopantoate reductase family protein [Aggregatilineaceae bacterium]